MPNFSLRISNELLQYIQTQAQKENRSINGYLVNLVQEQQQEKIISNELEKTNKRIDDYATKQHLYYFRQAATNRNNFLICGGVASGKSLLLDAIKKITTSFARGMVIDLSSLDHLYDQLDILLMNNTFFKVITKDVRKIDKSYAISIFIDGKISEKIFNSKDSKTYITYLIKFISDNPDINFCIVLPNSCDNNPNQDDFTSSGEFLNLFDSKIATFKDECESYPYSKYFDIFCLYEILNLHNLIK